MEGQIAFKVLVHAGLYRDYLDLFLEHAIDDVAVEEMQEEHLLEIGITNSRHRHQILAARNDIIGGPAAVEEPAEVAPEQQQTEDNAITVSMLMRGSPAHTRLKNESTEDYLKRLPMINLSDRGISVIRHLELCSKLQVLYLSSNAIVSMQNLDSLTSLRNLYLDNNQISRIEGLSSLRNLEKLFLDFNQISVLEGLEHCERLEELHVGNQRIATPMLLDELSMAGISRSIRILYLPNNGIADPAHLWFFDRVEELDLRQNQINMNEDLIKALNCMKFLRKLWLVGNPLTKRLKYRDEMILCCSSTTELDGKEIHPNERQYIYRLKGKKLGIIKSSNGNLKKAHTVNLQVVGNKLD